MKNKKHLKNRRAYVPPIFYTELIYLESSILAGSIGLNINGDALVEDWIESDVEQEVTMPNFPITY